MFSNLKEKVQRNEANLLNAKTSLYRISRDMLFNHKQLNWRYVPSKGIFYAYADFVSSLDFKGANLMDGILKYEFNGVTAEAYYERYNGNIEVKISLSDKINDYDSDPVRMVKDYLINLRQEKYVDFVTQLTESAKAYFAANEKRICDYLEAYVNRQGHIEDGQFMVWAADKAVEESTKKAISVKIYPASEEYLSDGYSYCPVFFFNEKNETSIFKNGVKVNILRFGSSEATDYMYVRFELLSSENNALKAALKAARYFEDSRRKKSYTDFLHRIEEATWEKGDSCFISYVPIIWDDYAEYYIKQLKKEYLILEAEVEKRIVPKYDIFTESTCIKISVLNLE